MPRVIYAADIGSTRFQRAASGFGWARIGTDGHVEGGRSIHELATAIVGDLRQGYSVALGIEAPLTIPVPIEAAALSYGRTGEGNRSFAAPVGLAVTTPGLHQTAWLLDEVRSQLGNDAARVWFSHEADAWPPKVLTLFCWEAFVSGKAHGKEHVQDAVTAALSFAAAENDLLSANAVHSVRPLTVIGTAAHRVAGSPTLRHSMHRVS